MATDTYVSIDEFLNSRKDYVKSGDILMKCTVQTPSLEAEVKRMRPASSWNPEKRTIRFVMSSELEDRDKDIILQAGLNIERFLENPIAFYNHNARDFPVGGWNDLEKILTGRPKRTEGTLQVLPEGVEPNADRLARHFGVGSIKTASIGFIPIRVKRRERPTDAKDEYGFNGYFIEESEMVECSAVNIPSNTAALAKMAADGDVRAREEIELVLDTWARHPETGLIIPRSEFEAAYKQAMGERSSVVLEKAASKNSVSSMMTRMKATMDNAMGELKDAIDLHAAHMNGTEPTSEASQKKMMRMMERSYALMGGEESMSMSMGRSAGKAADTQSPSEAPNDPAQPESPPAPPAAPSEPPPAPPADPDPASQPPVEQDAPLTEEQKDGLLRWFWKWFNGQPSSEEAAERLAEQRRKDAEEAVRVAAMDEVRRQIREAEKSALQHEIRSTLTELEGKGLV